jgi:hypothetical protein
MATTAQLLADAEAAYHTLLTGGAVASFKDSNGETVTYNIADADKLAAYIDVLKTKLNPCRRVNAPMRIFFA